MIKQNPPVRITIESHGNKFSAELSWDSSLDDIFPALLGLFVSSGYSQEGVLDYIVNWADDINEMREEKPNPETEEVEKQYNLGPF